MCIRDRSETAPTLTWDQWATSSVCAQDVRFPLRSHQDACTCTVLIVTCISAGAVDILLARVSNTPHTPISGAAQEHEQRTDCKVISICQGSVAVSNVVYTNISISPVNSILCSLANSEACVLLQVVSVLRCMVFRVHDPSSRYSW